MSIFDSLASVEEEIINCMKCGNCQAVCPIYQISLREPAVARGKIYLAVALLRGELDATAALAGRFDLCLTCLACVDACPSGVQVDRIILAARTELAKSKGLPPVKEVLFRGIRRHGFMAWGAKAVSRFQGLVFKRLDSEKMRPRFPLGLDRRRIIPPLAPVNLLEQIAGEHTVERSLARVAYFAGCLANYLYPEIGLALLKVLKANRVSVVVPRRQHCCGAPLFYNGAAGMVREMAKSHVDIFGPASYDAVITACGTCGESFCQYYPELLEGIPGYAKKAQDLAAKTMDISVFLNNLPLRKDILQPLERTVTYHQPCHLGRGLGVVSEPPALIQSIPGIKLALLQEPGRCCGNAGSFSLTHYQLSVRIRERKLKDIASTGAQIVVTGCPACKMHLREGLFQEEMPQRVTHTVELLARSCAGEGW
jgi:glycolate oxidase iron-sulfur subunit